MKSKLTITVASILSVLVLVGVGFAAWVIINPSVKEEQGGSITAETVTDNSYTLEAKIEGGEIVFGAPETPDATTSTPWLTNSTKEDLNATLTLTIKYNDWRYVPDNFSVTMTTTKKENSIFNTLRDGVSINGKTFNIISDPTISYGTKSTVETVVMNGEAKTIAKTAFTNNESSKVATLTVTIAFKWGANGNPYNYYNSLDYITNREEAAAVLNKLAELNAESYTITIQGTTNKVSE